MSGDRLAQIERRQPRWVQNSLNGFRKEITLTVEERDALVEIAKAVRAAEPVLDELIGWINTDLIGCLEVEQRSEQARLAIRSALARLDSGATGGGAK